MDDRRATRTEGLDDRFFGTLAAGKTVTTAAKAASYSRRAVYDWRKSDQAFSDRWSDAVGVAIERMEAEADRRAITGTLRPVFYGGAQCGRVREYSDTLLIFRLKALKPEMYRERASIEHTGADGKDLIPAESDNTKIALRLLNILRPKEATE
jgi:hypothetical protein